MGADFFEGIVQSPVETSAGSCDLPILYRDGSVVGLMYRVAPELVAPLISEPDAFEPFTLMGKALVQLVVFEYRDTSIGPYQEVALAVEVRRRGSKVSTWGALFDAPSQPDYGSWFLNLPVTTASACAAGREIWGYPKYVTDIETSFTDAKIHAVQKGEFELTVGPAGWLETPGIPFVLMSKRGGTVVRTIVRTNHPLRWGGAGEVKLKILGSGPTADNLEELDLADVSPSFVWRAMKMQSILPKGEDQS